MSRIFLSHSSNDNLAARALGNWLSDEGWDDVFLDIDPTRGIAPGERWERRLHEAANRCEAVIFLISRHWLESEWCRREFRLARRLNKRLFGVLIEDRQPQSLPEELRDTWQLCNLGGGTDHRMFRAALPDGSEGHVTFSAAGLARLKEGLTRAGLDPRFFSWPPESDPERLPYRGLAPLEAEDAGIFFGREAPTIEALDMLRGLVEAAPPQIVAILGASGAGKSSFLRAGLLPRLLRDEQSFAVLPVVRPRRAAVSGETGLVTALERAGARRSRSDLRRIVNDGGAALATLVSELFPMRGNAALILAVDQAEELFVDGGEEASVFLRRVRELAENPSLRLLVLLTIRSDAYDRLQNAVELDGIAPRPFNLSPVARGAYQTIIEGPAARYVAAGRKLAIDPKLTAALLSDLEQGGSKDALPLLAFTLERLLAEYGGDGDLTLAEYQGFGGLAGAIKHAVEDALAAADADPAVARDHAARLSLLRRGLIPWLAGIDPATNSPRRKTALWSDIPAESQPLVRYLINARLLATDSDAEGRQTVEVAHEALLRQWGVLKGWLEEDLAALSALDGVKDAARDWAANARDPTFLVHAGSRLAAAEGLKQRADLAANLGSQEREYLDAARAVEDARKNRELVQAQRLARRTFVGLAIALALLAISVVAGIYALQQQGLADASARAATYNETLGLVAMSDASRQAGRTRDAVELAVAALPRAGDEARPMLAGALTALSKALPALGESRRIEGSFRDVLVPAAGSSVVLRNSSNQAEIWDSAAMARLRTLGSPRPAGKYVNLVPSTDGRRLLLRSDDVTEIYDIASGTLLLTSGSEARLHGVALSDDGHLALFASSDGGAEIWDVDKAARLSALQADASELIVLGAFSPDAESIVTTTLTNVVAWNVADGQRLRTIRPPSTNAAVLLGLGFLDERRVVLSPLEGTLVVWDTGTGQRLAEIKSCGANNEPAVLQIAPDRKSFVVACSQQGAVVYDSSSLQPRAFVQGETLASPRFSPDGRLLGDIEQQNRLNVWDAQTGELVASFSRAGINAIAFNMDNDIVSTALDAPAWLWRTGARTNYRTLGSTQEYVGALDFTPDGRAIAAVTSADEVLLVPIDGSPVEQLWQGEPVHFVRLSPDGKMIILGAPQSGAVKLVDRQSRRLIATIPQQELTGAAMSPDGTLVAITTIKGQLSLWSSSGELVWQRQVGDSGLFGVAFSPEGSRLAVAPFVYGKPTVWNVKTGELMATFAADAPGLNTVAFSSDGQHVVSGGLTAGVIWNPATGEPEVVLRGDVFALNAQFLPGNRVVTASGSSAIVWDAQSGIAIAAYGAMQNGTRLVGATPDGTHIVTASDSGLLRAWDLADLPPGEALAAACRQLEATDDFEDVARSYGLRTLKPICAPGHEPLAFDPERMQP